MIGLPTARGLTRYNPANGKTARFLQNESDSASLTKRATLETKDGTFWVAASASVDIFDRQTGRVTQHFLLRNPLQKPGSRGNPYVRHSSVKRANWPGTCPPSTALENV